MFKFTQNPDQSANSSLGVVVSGMNSVGLTVPPDHQVCECTYSEPGLTFAFLTRSALDFAKYKQEGWVISERELAEEIEFSRRQPGKVPEPLPAVELERIKQNIVNALSVWWNDENGNSKPVKIRVKP